MKWTYKNKTITSLDNIPEGAIGFIYEITNIKSKRFYIGRKILFNTTKTRISKREKTQTKTRKTFKKVIKESNWLNYTGSSKELNDDIKTLGKKAFKKEILKFCFSKKYLNFCELEFQINKKVLYTESYNANIAGKYYRKDME